MIRLPEFSEIVREFAMSQELDLDDGSLFEATVNAVAAALKEHNYQLSKATKLFVAHVHLWDKETMQDLHKSPTLRRVYHAV